jgi:serine/threonine protein kinase
VWKVIFKKTKKTFALKEMSKAKIVDRKSERSIMYERELLEKLKHP